MQHVDANAAVADAFDVAAEDVAQAVTAKHADDLAMLLELPEADLRILMAKPAIRSNVTETEQTADAHADHDLFIPAYERVAELLQQRGVEEDAALAFCDFMADVPQPVMNYRPSA